MITNRIISTANCFEPPHGEDVASKLFEEVQLISNQCTNSIESRAYCPCFKNLYNHGLASYTFFFEFATLCSIVYDT